jgi:tetratricopeptide (TPR) repeat protein
MREDEAGMEQKCPFCRESMPKSMEEAEKMNTERVKANDPIALCQMGMKCCNEGDYEGAVEHLAKAAELDLSFLYGEGEGVETDLKKKIYHLEEAAIGGHPSARYNLGCHEWNSGRHGRPDRAVKHFIIAAKLGHDRAWEEVKKGCQMGWASKEDYRVALRGYQAAIDATKSTQREEAEKAKREGSYHTLP